MTQAVLGLVAAYVLLALLLLSLNLRSAWRWPVKAAAILLTGSCFIGVFVAVQGLLGLPTPAPPPGHFHLHAAVVAEPDRAGRAAGAIYLWLSPKVVADQDPAPPAPRAYALPYSRQLHEAVARAQARMKEGGAVHGRAERSGRDGRGFSQAGPLIELYEPPVAALPPKTRS